MPCKFWSGIYDGISIKIFSLFIWIVLLVSKQLNALVDFKMTILVCLITFALVGFSS